jgi:hypothetical protein
LKEDGILLGYGKQKETIKLKTGRKRVHVNSIQEVNPMKTVHPTEEKWRVKLSHLTSEIQDKTLKLLLKYNHRLWKDGYLPPIKDCVYKIKYQGGQFREPVIPLSPEDVKCNDLFDEQISQGLLKEVKEHHHKLDY